jgi:hypothetical protein
LPGPGFALFPLVPVAPGRSGPFTLTSSFPSPGLVSPSGSLPHPTDAAARRRTMTDAVDVVLKRIARPPVDRIAVVQIRDEERDRPSMHTRRPRSNGSTGNQTVQPHLLPRRGDG